MQGYIRDQLRFIQQAGQRMREWMQHDAMPAGHHVQHGKSSFQYNLISLCHDVCALLLFPGNSDAVQARSRLGGADLKPFSFQDSCAEF